MERGGQRAHAHWRLAASDADRRQDLGHPRCTEGCFGGRWTVADDDYPIVVFDGKDDDGTLSEVLIATNDTARFNLSPIEIKGVMLFDYPTPSVLIKDSRYRLPRKLEVSDVLKNADLPTGYWQSRQRILCHDDEKGGYYTYVPHGNITQAGYKTAYCILPIRSERLPRQDGHVDIMVDDEWK